MIEPRQPGLRRLLMMKNSVPACLAVIASAWLAIALGALITHLI